ncbi:tetratricopeptide repeat protein [Rhodobacterales bacterium HKCCE3408]|nr:tetratricopeptide repeat protein [Rhodobacterales bacterium HKCCE3408]
MFAFRTILNSVVAALFVAVAGAASAQTDDRLTDLLDRLADPDTQNWEIVEQEIIQRWAISGSATADLLLSLGTAALDEGETQVAISHLTALVDHAPEFAEGWNARATAYYRAGLYGPAIYDIQHVLALNPNHFGAMIGLGIMLEDMGRSEEALEVFRAVHAIHPHRPDVEGAIQRIEHSLEGQTL